MSGKRTKRRARSKAGSGNANTPADTNALLVATKMQLSSKGSGGSTTSSPKRGHHRKSSSVTSVDTMGTNTSRGTNVSKSSRHTFRHSQAHGNSSFGGASMGIGFGIASARPVHVEDDHDHDLHEHLNNLSVASKEPVDRVLLKKWNESKVAETPHEPHIAPLQLLQLRGKHVVKAADPITANAQEAAKVAALRFHFEPRPNKPKSPQAGSPDHNHHHHPSRTSPSEHGKGEAKSPTPPKLNRLPSKQVTKTRARAMRHAAATALSDTTAERHKKGMKEARVPFHLQGDPKRWETAEMLQVRRDLMKHPEILRQIYRLWNLLNPQQVPIIVYDQDKQGQATRTPPTTRRRSHRRQESVDKNSPANSPAGKSQGGESRSGTPQSTRSSAGLVPLRTPVKHASTSP